MHKMKRKADHDIITIESSASDSETTDGETDPSERQRRRHFKTARTDKIAGTASLTDCDKTESKAISSPIRLNLNPNLPPSENIDSLTLREILHQGLVDTWQITFAIDLGYLISQIDPAERDTCEINIVSAEGNSIEDHKQLFHDPTRIKFHYIHIHDRFGTHHSKIMINFFRDETCQVVVHTANMIQIAWEEKSESIWLSPRLKRLAPSDDEGTGIGATFKADLMEYLTSYKRSTIKPLLDALNCYDFRPIRAIFIGSVPGSYPDSSTTYGMAKLKHILSQRSVSKEGKCTTVAQLSSLGSLGQAYYQTFQSLLATSREGVTTACSFRLLFPTFENIKNSIEGWRSGATLFFNSTKAGGKRQIELSKNHLCSWRSMEAGRERVMPHIKSYMRYNTLPSTNGQSPRVEIQWFLLTSANLSKAAWGAKESGQFKIKSYEAGVLFFPDLFDAETMMPSYKTDTQHRDKGSVNLRMAYDIPPAAYTSTDEIWSVNRAMERDPGPDWLGNSFKESMMSSL